MHSRMRTGRSLTICWGVSFPGGAGFPGGSASRGCLLPGGSASGGGCLLPWGCGIPTCTDADPPPPREQNHRHEQKHNFGHNFVAAGKNVKLVSFMFDRNEVSLAVVDLRFLIERANLWGTGLHENENY